jgi:hypothetical protein
LPIFIKIKSSGNFISLVGKSSFGSQGAGIADGGEFYIRPPGTAAQ